MFLLVLSFLFLLGSQFEENFEEINAVEEQASIPETSSVNENASGPSSNPENGGDEMAIQGIEAQRIFSETSTSQDFVSGILKIVPEVDVSRWLQQWIINT